MATRRRSPPRDARGRFVDRDKGYNKVVTNLGRLGSVRGAGAYVGVTAEAGTTDEGVPLVLVARVQEFGAPSLDIPERSYLRSTVDRKRAEYLRRIRAELVSAIKAKNARLVLRRGLASLGERAVEDIRQAIVALTEPPNEPATQEDKLGNNPLIHTGGLHAAISSEVRGI